MAQASLATALVVPFEQLRMTDVEVVGGKNASLGEMISQLAHAGEITYFLAPYINSYKRFMAGTFAPTRAVWSFDNRTAGFRICGTDTKAVRVECRVGGADLNPYLAFETLLDAHERGEFPPEVDADEVVKRFIKSIGKGVLKVMSKMGISTYQSYCGAQIFDAVGLSSEFIEAFFTGTATTIEGAGLVQIAEETVRRHRDTLFRRESKGKNHGSLRKRFLGGHFL
jgi:hypothetical protein